VKKKKTVLLSAAALVLLAAVAAAVLLSRRVDFARLRKGRDFNVILITVDTLRADKVGCYGEREVETPTMDLFAARGLRFERCISQTPLTLPSHTTIMTGTLPPYHGVRDNGGFVVPPELVTLAELFKGKGYQTAAFVAAYVLDSKWGLNQGFDTYFDKFDLSRFEHISLGEVQRPANEVIDEVLPWLDKAKDRKFFAWIHLYDPHTPYDPPEPFKTSYASHPYLGEIAFTDTQLARLWRYLGTNGLLNNLFLVFASDHGESLGEHDEGSHGFFIYQATLHVPLILVTPFPKFQGLTSPQTVSLADIMPTVCEMAGLPVPAAVQGRSLVPSFSRPGASDDRLAYSECYFPRYHYGWSELRSVQDRRFKLIVAPVPELYDLVADPHEEKNLASLEKRRLEELTAKANAMMESAGRNALESDLRKVDEETREKLAALGYLGSFTNPAKLKEKRLANPKDKIGIFNDLSRAREIGLEGKPEEAIAVIQRIIADDPTIADAHFALGNLFYHEKKFKEALPAFLKALDLKPDDSFCVINIANSYQAMGQYDEAERFVLDYMKKGFPDSQLMFLLGNLNVHRGNPDKAIGYFEQCLALGPHSASSHNALGAIYLSRDDLPKAEEHLKAAMGINAKLLSLRYNMAQLLEKQNRPAEAVDYYLREIQDSPKSYRALYNLSRLYRSLGQEEEEYQTLRKTIEANPEFPLSYFYLARIYLNRGERFPEAIDLVKKGIGLKPDRSELPLGYFLMADLYNRAGDSARSQEYAEKGQALAAALKNGK
jgi:arylsulfatase A-like enzyme/uncharacterized protein HemY